MVTESAEEYLEAICKLGEEGQPVALSALAKHLEISSVSANEMVRKLVERDLVLYEPYKGVSLTPAGRIQALAVIRRHRLWERFLTDVLGLSWDLVHEEACRLEHVTSPLVEERLAQFLGQPETCPHGNPMPTAAGEMTLEAGCPLAELTAGQRAIVLRVPEEDVALLRYLATLGLEPQVTVQVEAAAPFQGPLTVRVGEAQHVLGRELASQIVVRPL
ncbi:MAG: metal-dependent transcriptional regulator [Anaerolineales bacterium]|nr:MAG: metal-dependent transcriptional regulator [Anaerolineales bacterium]